MSHFRSSASSILWLLKRFGLDLLICEYPFPLFCAFDGGEHCLAFDSVPQKELEVFWAVDWNEGFDGGVITTQV